MAETSTTPATAKAKPAAKKTSTTSAAKTKSTAAKAAAPAKKPAAPRKTAAKKVAAPGAEQRYKMIEVAAYYIAERSGFTADPLASWAEAERQIDQMLSK